MDYGAVGYEVLNSLELCRSAEVAQEAVKRLVSLAADREHTAVVKFAEVAGFNIGDPDTDYPVLGYVITLRTIEEEHPDGTASYRLGYRIARKS